MADFKELYFHLFGVLADAVETIEAGNAERAKELLIVAMQEAEERYMEEE